MKKVFILSLSLLASHMMRAQCPTPVTCYDVILSGTLSARHLSADSTYLLRGNVIIPNSSTLTIDAGTVIFGEAATSGTLVIETGGELISNGTSNNPVIFTSDQGTEECKLTNRWGGIKVAGTAPNNNNNSISITLPGSYTLTGGGTNANSNSGQFRNMRIEYADRGLTMVSVGLGTIVENVQISYSENNGMELYGGNVRFRKVVYFDNQGHDLMITNGNTSWAQSLLFLRTDPLLFQIPYSNAILVKNNDNILNDYEGFPGSDNTHPVISNFTILGQPYCNEEYLPDYNGIEIINNGEGEFYNGYTSGTNIGLKIDEDKAVANANRTASPQIFYAYNNFSSNNSDALSVTSWPLLVPFCANNINNWLSGLGCSQSGIEFNASESLSSSLCGDYCENRPEFVLSDSDYESNFDLLPGTFFDEGLSFRGAVQENDWTESWAAYCPIDYCLRTLSKTQRTDNIKSGSDISVYPNPGSENITVNIRQTTHSEAEVMIINSIGQVIYTASIELQAGETQHTINTQHFNTGIYFVKVFADNNTIGQATMIIQ